MIYSEKVKAYQKLVNDIHNCPKLPECNISISSKTAQLEKCQFCNEVNLWSYWHGGIHNLDADILLVGQDWGSFSHNKYEGFIHLLKANCKKPERDYTYPLEQSITDQNLCELFDKLGEKYNIRNHNNRNVFFTNFVLCYRASQNISGGFRQKWANNCSEYFERLVEIIQPKVIICLGRNVFDAVVRVAGLEPPRHKYNDTIQKGELILTFNDTTCVVFPMAHCGVFGTNNRNKGCNYRGLTLQKSDWGKIKDYL